MIDIGNSYIVPLKYRGLKYVVVVLFLVKIHIVNQTK